jgi:molybdopterin-guanine dinucleotide biosynthesis protein A
MSSLPISAYVLAGGRSARMGQDKALLSLAGKPLIRHAIEKLSTLTGEVAILSGQPELAPFAPLVPDLRESCGPLGGIEAALSLSRHDWSLIVPVDVPFFPTALLRSWTEKVLSQPAARVALFVVDGIPHPALCLVHREMLPFLSTAANQGRFKLYPVFEEAARCLAHRNSLPVNQTLLRWEWKEADAAVVIDSMQKNREEHLVEPRLWFANLNTPEEFQEAQRYLDMLES